MTQLLLLFGVAVLVALNGLYSRLARIQGTTFIEESFERLLTKSE